MKFQRKPVVYVSGPLTKGDLMINVREAIFDAEEIIAEGGIPIVPHLTVLWHLLSPHEWQFWIDYDLGFLPVLDALYRRPGDSNGGDIEVANMGERGKPVFFDKFKRKRWIATWNLAGKFERDIARLDSLDELDAFEESERAGLEIHLEELVKELEVANGH